MRGWVGGGRGECVMGDRGGQHRCAAGSGVCSYRDKNTYKRLVVQVPKKLLSII